MSHLRDNRMKRIGILGLALGILLAQPAAAGDFAYHRSVSLKVGQSIVLKGVRNHNCGTRPPGWASIQRQLPKSKLGSFSDGGTGTVQSNFCRERHDIKRVAARGVRFTARTRGQERLTILRDPVSITVR